MAEELERIYIIPLKNVGYKHSKAAPTAIKRVKDFLTRHMKVEKENIWIDDSLNKVIWSCGKFKMPNKIRVKAVKFEDGVVEAYLPELEYKKSRRELLREEREKKEPILKKEEVKEEKEEEAATVEEEYKIAPTAEGEVKIKKKKAPRKKKPEEKTAEVKELKEEKEEKKEKKAPKKKKAVKEKKQQKKTKTKKTSKSSKKEAESTEPEKK